MQVQAHNETRNGKTHTVRQSGFTLLEMMFAVAVSSIVMAGVVTTFLWATRQAYRVRIQCWAQVETLKSSTRVIGHIRQAQAINDIDDTGNWVELYMPDGTVCRFVYDNPTGRSGDGQMLYRASMLNTSEAKIVAQGLSKVMSTPVRNVFEKTSDNTLRIAYRVTQPMEPVDIPAEIDIGVRLRNQ